MAGRPIVASLSLLLSLSAAAVLAADDAESMRDAVASLPDARAVLQSARQAGKGMIDIPEAMSVDLRHRQQKTQKPPKGPLKGAVFYASNVEGYDTQLVPDWFTLRMLSGETGELQFDSMYGMGPMGIIPRHKTTVLKVSVAPVKGGDLKVTLAADGATVAPNEILVSGREGSVQTTTVGVVTEARNKGLAFSFSLTIHSGPAKVHEFEEFDSGNGGSYSHTLMVDVE